MPAVAGLCSGNYPFQMQILLLFVAVQAAIAEMVVTVKVGIVWEVEVAAGFEAEMVEFVDQLAFELGFGLGFELG